MREARVGCAILAAGAGERFGVPGDKLVAPLHGKPLLAYAVDAACASSAATCVLVLGAAADRVALGVDTRRCAVVTNERWRAGLAASIACAVTHLRACDAVILMLGDQPNVTAADLDALGAAHARDPKRIVALRAGRVWGAPVLFPARDFPALCDLRGDAGAKGYATRHAARLEFVRARRADAFADVDVRADLTRRRASKTRRTRRSPARR